MVIFKVVWKRVSLGNTQKKTRYGHSANKLLCNCCYQSLRFEAFYLSRSPSNFNLIIARLCRQQTNLRRNIFWPVWSYTAKSSLKYFSTTSAAFREAALKQHDLVKASSIAAFFSNINSHSCKKYSVDARIVRKWPHQPASRFNAPQAH